MTVLTTQMIGLRAAATSVGSRRLVTFLAEAYRHFSEIALNFGGRVIPATDQDLSILWEGAKAGNSVNQACQAAWSLGQRSRELRQSLVSRYGIEINPRTSVVTDIPVFQDRCSARASSGIQLSEMRRWAQLLQRANTQFETQILVDETTATLAAEEFEFCEVDYLTRDEEGLLQQRKVIEETGLDWDRVPDLLGSPQGISELLGPRGKVAPGRLGSAMAFRGAMELYRQGERKKAASVFELLATDSYRGRLARIYMNHCEQGNPCSEKALGDQEGAGAAKPA